MKASAVSVLHLLFISFFPAISSSVTRKTLTSCSDAFIYPCKCEDVGTVIGCYSHHISNLSQIVEYSFASSPRSQFIYHLSLLAVRSGEFMIPVYELAANTFSGYIFNDIAISNTPLRRIHLNSFPDSLNYTTTLNLGYNQLSYDPPRHRTARRSDRSGDNESQSWSASQDAEYDLFAFIRQFPLLTHVFLNNNRIKHLPSWAFSSLSRLQAIELSNNHIASTGIYPFFPVRNLFRVDMTENLLTQLVPELLRFEDSERLIEVELVHNRLTSDGIPFLNNTNRPLKLNISRNRLTTVSRRAFEILFQKQPISQVSLGYNPVRCDCGLIWLFEKKDFYQNRVLDINCSHEQTSFFNFTPSSLRDC